MKKKLLLITSNKVGDTGRVSFAYIFQDSKLDAYDKYPAQCSGPFGMVTQPERDQDTLYMNVFKGGSGLVFAGPLMADDADRNVKLVEECFPDAFNMLCTTEIAERVKSLIGHIVDIEVIRSEQTLLTA